MITKTITYTDYNDEPVTDTLHFHISKSELLDNVHLRDKFEDLSTRLSGEARELNEDEVKEILDLVKELIRLSYGVRSEDGKKFRKSKEIYDDFADSAAYDAVLFQLFEDQNAALAFMQGIIPKDLIEAARKRAEEAEHGKRPQDFLKKKDATPSDQKTVKFDGEVEGENEESQPTPSESIEELEARLAAARAAQS